VAGTNSEYISMADNVEIAGRDGLIYRFGY
jgi:hypothetical protein